MKRIIHSIAAVTAAFAITAVAQADTLSDVKSRGVLRCVVSTGVAGFAYPDASGNWKGFDVDFCRATAAAVLGDAKKNKGCNINWKNSFYAFKLWRR
jgi:general L-amino acid transport system substrate-binding protein